MTSSRRVERTVHGQAVEEPSSYRLRWSRRAEADLEGIHDYIAADNPAAAARWIEKLLARAEKASLLPYASRVVPEFGREDLREVGVRTYRIVYRIREQEVQVITVFEGHRLFPAEADVEGELIKRGSGNKYARRVAILSLPPSRETIGAWVPSAFPTNSSASRKAAFMNSEADLRESEALTSDRRRGSVKRRKWIRKWIRRTVPLKHRCVRTWRKLAFDTHLPRETQTHQYGGVIENSGKR